MSKKAQGLAYSIAALTWLTGMGCGSDPPPCALIGGQYPLVETALALTKEAVLLRAGDGFVLAGLNGPNVHWGRLSNTGEIQQETEFALPEQPATTTGSLPLGPVFAVISKTTSSVQLVTAVGVLKAGTTDRYEIHAYIHDLAAPAAPVMLTIGELAAASSSGTIRLAAGNSPSGTGGALVLWGVEGQRAPISFQMIGADGALVGQVQKLLDDPDPNNIPRWSCVNTTQNGSNLAITLVEAPNSGHPQRSAWRRFVINDDSSIGESAAFELTPDVSDCRLVSMPTSVGHLVAWQNNSNHGGTYFANMTPPPPDAGPEAYDNVVTKKALASELYGGYASMPRLAWVAPAEYDVTIGLAQTRGPEVVRYDLFGDPRGRALYLPSVSGHTGPVSAWADLDAVYVTYLDMARASTAGVPVPAGSKRLLVKVQPAVLR
jgi:hypothetical protein